MQKKVVITIDGLHNRQGDEERLINTSSGILEVLDSEIVVNGDEQVDESGEKVRTIFRIRDGRIKMVRKGNFSSVMIFEKGYDHHVDYATPYGTMDMLVKTSSLDINKEDISNIIANVEYELLMDDKTMSRAKVKIEVKEDMN